MLQDKLGGVEHNAWKISVVSTSGARPQSVPLGGTRGGKAQTFSTFYGTFLAVCSFTTLNPAGTAKYAASGSDREMLLTVIVTVP